MLILSEAGGRVGRWAGCVVNKLVDNREPSLHDLTSLHYRANDEDSNEETAEEEEATEQSQEQQVAAEVQRQMAAFLRGNAKEAKGNAKEAKGKKESGQESCGQESQKELSRPWYVQKISFTYERFFHFMK